MDGRVKTLTGMKPGDVFQIRIDHNPHMIALNNLDKGSKIQYNTALVNQLTSRLRDTCIFDKTNADRFMYPKIRSLGGADNC